MLTREAQLPGDRHRRGWMVARDHHRPDSRRLACAYRHPDLLARRIDHPDQAHEDQVLLAARRLVGCVGVESIRQGQNAQCSGGHPRTRTKYVGAPLGRQRLDPAVPQLPFALGQDNLGSTLGVHGG